MATDERSVVFLQTTDGEFRTWVAEVIAQVTATGVTITSDTGQIDTATVAKPGAISTSMGYIIFRFNDTMQGTTPVYVKLEFGSGSTGATVPAFWMTVGSSTDGAGTITGTTYRARQTLPMTTANATSWPIKACYSTATGMFWANWLNAQAATGSVQFWVARGCDPITGTPTGTCILTLLAQGSLSPRVYDVASATTDTSPGVLLHPTSLSTSEYVFMHEGRIVAQAAATVLDSGYYVAFPGIFAVFARHLPVYQLCYMTPFDTERAYIAMTNGAGGYNLGANANNNDSPVLIWE